jgi:N-methylhydantoinase B
MTLPIVNRVPLESRPGRDRTQPSDNVGSTLDPIGLEILWNRLISVADDAATTLVRTAFSPIVRESNDFACVIFDAVGNSIAENTIGIPSFNMTMGRTLASFLQFRPADQWQPGDVGLTNDPWLASGHLPDMTVLTPIFMDERLLGWTGSIVHHADVGGSIWSADSREVFEEGIRIPPMLLIKAGQLNEELMTVYRANLRIPQQVVGDLMAQVAAGRTAGHQLVEVTREAGLSELGAISEQVCGLAENSMRSVIAALPDGTYRSSTDLDGAGQEPIHIEVAIIIDGDSMVVDYAGTSPQVGVALNTVMNYTEAYTCYPLKCALDPTTPRNQGSYRPITVRAPEGSILNPRFPAAVNSRHVVGLRLTDALFSALGQVVPDRVIAESGGASVTFVFSGPSHRSRRFSTPLFSNGGMGARPDRDGLNTISYPSLTLCGSMEVMEATAPLRIWRKELKTDSGGPGRFRGGIGQEVEVELLAPAECTMSLFVERMQHLPHGYFGGHDGGASGVEWNGQTTGFPLKGRSQVKPGDRIVGTYSGGGGYGDPRERKRAAVESDLEAGLISERAAKEVYGLGFSSPEDGSHTSYQVPD